MSRESAETVRRVMGAWERGDTAAFLDGLDPEVELVTDPGWPEPGSVRGREQVGRWLNDYQETFAERTAVVEQILVAGDRVLVRFVDEVTGRRSGLSTENRVSTVYTLRNSRIGRIEYFRDHQDALEAIGRPG